MKIRIKDLMQITTTASYNLIFVTDSKHDMAVNVYNTVSNYDMKKLSERTEYVNLFWVSGNEMFIVI